MHRPRAAEGHEREVRRIVAAFDGDDPECAQHLRVHDVDHRSGIETAERTLGCGAVQLDTPGQALRQPAEQEVRIGDRRLGPASSVTGWPGLCGRTLRADAYCAPPVTPADPA